MKWNKDILIIICIVVLFVVTPYIIFVSITPDKQDLIIVAKKWVKHHELNGAKLDCSGSVTARHTDCTVSYASKENYRKVIQISCNPDYCWLHE